MRQWEAEIPGEEKVWLLGKSEVALFSRLARTPGVKLRLVGCPEILEMEDGEEVRR